MGVLEEVTKMKREGKNEDEIFKELKQKKISPKEIEDTLNQSKIKDAVSEEEGLEPPQFSDKDYEQEGEDYGQGYPSQEGYGQGFQQPPQQYQQEGYEQEYYPQEGYGQGGYQQDNTDTMIEVSEQVFSEKTKDIRKKIDELNEFKVLTQTKLENALDRLKKIEHTIDKLQSAILDKIGSYGGDLSDIKKEMSMMQDSFRKVAEKGHYHTAPKSKTTKKTSKTHKTSKKR